MSIDVQVYYPTEIALRNGDDNPGLQRVRMTSQDLALLLPSEREELAAYVAPTGQSLRVERAMAQGVIDAIRSQAARRREAMALWKGQLLAEPQRLWRVRSDDGVAVATRNSAFADICPRLDSVNMHGEMLSPTREQEQALLADPDVVAVVEAGRLLVQAEADKANAERAAREAETKRREEERKQEEQRYREQAAAVQAQRVAWLEQHSSVLDMDGVLVRAAREGRDVWPEVRTAILEHLHMVVLDTLSVLDAGVQREIGLLASASEVNMLRKGRRAERRERPSRIAYAVLDRLREGNLASMMALQIGLGCTITVDDVVRVDLAARAAYPIYHLTAVQISFHCPLFWDDEALQLFVPCERVDEDKVNGEGDEDDEDEV